MAIRRSPVLAAVVAVLLVLLVLVRPPAALSRSGAAGPQFLERTPLSIPLDRLGGGRTWQVAIVNPGPSTEVEVRVVGPIADALVIRGPRRPPVPSGGTASVVMAPGPRPHAGTGELVLFSATGIDRRQVVVTAPFLERYRLPIALGGLVLVAGAAAGVLLRARSRRRRRDREEILRSPSPPVRSPAGFTHTDEPAEADGLNRSEYAEGLAHLAASAAPPLVIGVFGEWGTGKTSMLKQVRKVIESDYGHCAHAWFDPWRHQYDTNPVLPLLHTVVRDLGLERQQGLRRKLGLISEVLGSLVLRSSVQLSVADMRKSLESYDEQNFLIRSEHAKLDGHLETLITRALQAQGKSRLVVFIDDLDRCHADQIVALLEALKLHFSRNNCVFLLGVAKEPLNAAVEQRYEGQPVGDYLEKIVQIPFEMPRMSDAAFEGYVDVLLTDDIRPAGRLLKIGLRRNPRTIKRFVNVLILQDRVAKDRGLEHYDVSVLAAVLLIRDGDQGFYVQLTENPTLLKRIAEDIDTAGDDRLPAWNPLPLRIVQEFPGGRHRLPGDIGSYIDLVKVSPVVQRGDAVAAAEEEPAPQTSSPFPGPAGSELGVLRERAQQHVSRVLGDEGALLTPVVRFAGGAARKTRPEEIAARTDTGLVITGEPGSGRTVLAARLARRLIEEGAVPVFMELRTLRRDRSNPQLRLAHALAAEHEIALPEAFDLVRRGSLVYVIDGLGEPDGQANAGRLMEELARGLTRSRFVMIDRDGSALGPATGSPHFETVEVLGVPPEDGRRRLEELLAARDVRPERLGALAPELARSPQFVSALTSSPAWVDALPAEPVDFLPWYARWAQAGLDVADVERGKAAEALRELAAHSRTEGVEEFTGEEMDIREIFRGCGIVGVQVPAALKAMVAAGILSRRPSGAYRFVHALLRDRLAG
ncbi:P-loop NTPase fold protein [Planomonospora venezuelensis]|uniref:Cdc6-like AAA superfamily ATPase n=1 Tax=Planomonospora venezuelensis TaxID=1999 RepID=A0A841D1I5_PLAVE|nr:P-loop NTPase fold protein [Planomonospora venezuelensis]MBB5963600.1 Cdc6-like AAA superfamily ATPase [Planomonospora venezuelensis]GIN01388.1 hypothetical protein Pve01_30460 [Planomonospora venezuelensis]